MTSTRPKQQQLALNFVNNFAGEDETRRDAQEPQGGSIVRGGQRASGSAQLEMHQSGPVG